MTNGMSKWLQVSYRVIGRLWGDGLRYIIIEAKGEAVRIAIQHAVHNVSHWRVGRDCKCTA